MNLHLSFLYLIVHLTIEAFCVLVSMRLSNIPLLFLGRLSMAEICMAQYEYTCEACLQCPTIELSHPSGVHQFTCDLHAHNHSGRWAKWLHIYIRENDLCLCYSCYLFYNCYIYTHVTHSHLRSKELPGLHFVCSPASRVTYEM